MLNDEKEIRDIELYQKYKEQEERKQKESVPWISRVPPKYILISALILIGLFMYFDANKISRFNIIYVALLEIIVLYLISRNLSDSLGKILTPEEAFLALKKDIQQRQRMDRMPRGVNLHYTEIDRLHFEDGSPAHYHIGFNFRNLKGATEFKRATVYASGDVKAYVTIQDIETKYLGLDDKDTVHIMTEMENRMKEHGLTARDMLFRNQQR